jgi:hypothetical protein|tara:strand:- start:1298 stop:2008 length:711 start_codon:yes stop_codon:yes gene_type:complete
MTTNLGWCWAGAIPDLLVIEPERFKTPKVVNKNYSKRGIIDCPSYQGFYNNLFLLKSPVSFDAEVKDGIVVITSKEVDEHQLHNLFTIHPKEDMHDVKKPLFQFNLNYLFVADEPCLMEILPPFMHNENLPGEVVGGAFNIHKWIRTISWGFIFAKTSSKLSIKRGDTLCYIKFTTPNLTNKVGLEECILTQELIGELDRKRFLTNFKKGGIINLMNRALKLRPKKLIKRMPTINE